MTLTVFFKNYCNKIFDVFIQKIKIWRLLGIILSVAWAVGISVIYFDEIANHPSYVSNYDHYFYSAFHNSFEWEKDIEATNKAHEDMDFSYDYFLIKPIFNLFGYLKLILLPIIMGWLLAFISNIIVWKRRREILSMITERIHRISPIKAFIAIMLMISYLILYPFLNEMLGLQQNFFTIPWMLLIVLANKNLWVFIFLFWFAWNLLSLLKALNDTWKKSIERHRCCNEKDCN